MLPFPVQSMFRAGRSTIRGSTNAQAKPNRGRQLRFKLGDLWLGMIVPAPLLKAAF
jgi:hypothetical protein